MAREIAPARIESSSASGRWATLWLIVGLLSLGTTAYAGETPCDYLQGEEAERFQALNQEMAKHYQAKEWPATIKAIIELRKICEKDPTHMLNLARVYQRSGDCSMAMFWYEKVLAFPKSPSNEAVLAGLQTKAGIRVAELQVTCLDSATLDVGCSDPQVFITIADHDGVTCPFSGRLKAGSHVLQATREGYTPFEMTVQLEAGRDNQVTIPHLSPVVAPIEAPTTGMLRVTCPDGVRRVRLAGPEGTEDLDCPLESELPAGAYTVALPESESFESVELRAGETFNVTLQQPTSAERIGLFIALRVAPGSGWARGDTYRTNLKTRVGTLDGYQPSAVTFAVENEIGFDFNEWLGAGAQTRIDVVNFSLLVSAFARGRMTFSDTLALRLDLGVGYGEVLQPYIRDFDGQTSLLRLAPYFATAGVGISWRLTDTLALVGLTEPRLVLPDMAIQLDWLSLGVELLL